MSALTVATIPVRHSAHTLLGTIRWLREDPENRRVKPRDYFAQEMTLADFERWFADRLQAKINSHLPEPLNPPGVALRRLNARGSRYVGGWLPEHVERERAWRKLSEDWQRSAHHFSRVANSRQRMHVGQVPYELRERFAQRIARDGDA